MARKSMMSAEDEEQFRELHPNSPLPPLSEAEGGTEPAPQSADTAPEETPAEEPATTETAAEATVEATEPEAPAIEGDSAEPETPNVITLEAALRVVFAHCPSGSAATGSGQIAWDEGKVILNTLGVAL